MAARANLAWFAGTRGPNLRTADLNRHRSVPAGVKIRLLEYDFAIVWIVGGKQQCASVETDLRDLKHRTPRCGVAQHAIAVVRDAVLPTSGYGRLVKCEVDKLSQPLCRWHR